MIQSERFKQFLFCLLLLLTLLPLVDATEALAAGIALSLLLGNPFPSLTATGSRRLLQLSVVGLGFGIGIGKVLADGKSSIVYTVLTIAATLLLGALLGRIFRVSPSTSRLLSFGTAICGGSAIAALAPSIKARPEETAVALATVFTLNAVGLLLFPWLGGLLNMDQQAFGLWAALAIHDTSSVVGAASAYGSEALALGVTVKLTRALWIAPFVLVLSVVYNGKGKAAVPLFILGFILAACIRAAWPEQSAIWDTLAQLSRRLLVVTLFLIGTGLSREVLRRVGLAPLLQAVALWLLVSISTLLLILNNVISA